MNKSVDAYIEKNRWKSGLKALRSILLSTELNEEIKWGTPHYTLNGKNVVGIAGFKSYFGLWFHQGVFLKDSHKVLINAQEGTTRGLRQWRFTTIPEINPEVVKSYVLEAIDNQRAGKEIKPREKKLLLSDALKEVLSQDTELAEGFEKLSPGKQREYADHINEAKQEKTRLGRLQKIIPMIKSGVGLNDKYK